MAFTRGSDRLFVEVALLVPVAKSSKLRCSTKRVASKTQPPLFMHVPSTNAPNPTLSKSESGRNGNCRFDLIRSVHNRIQRFTRCSPHEHGGIDYFDGLVGVVDPEPLGGVVPEFGVVEPLLGVPYGIG
jgi:hypothetical protein